MSLRATLANSIIELGRALGNMMGLEMAVVVSSHSINTRMELPKKSNRAWDRTMFKRGNLFIDGYGNPIKPRVRQKPELENPDTVEVDEGEGKTEGSDTHAELITSGRYRVFMRQNLISQLLTPESRWNLLVWAVIGLGALIFINMIMTLWATGTF